LQAAFEAAHALKGVLGNLSLTDMFDKCSEITELLRAKTEIDYTPLINQLLSMRDELDAMRR
jgi:HPt (histidine-containing phosphotransfer) domain-containing protein